MFSFLQDKPTVSTSSLVTTAVNVALSLHIRTVDEGGGHGHILVFLTGKAECDAACNSMREALENLLNESKRKKQQLCVPNAIIIPLYANLSPEDQALVFEPTHEVVLFWFLILFFNV
jgi:HrpA-like RNA helicase